MEAYTAVTVPDLFVPGKYGLTDAINWLTAADVHWKNGIQYDSNCYEVNVTMNPCVSGAPDPISSKSATWSHVTRGAKAFTIYGEADCSAIGSDWYTNGQTQVLKSLSAAAPTQLERTLWSGVSGASPALVYPNLNSTGPIFDGTGRILLQPSATLVSGVPLDIVEALGRLEEAFGQCYDGVGVIHVPVVLAEAMCARNLVQEVGGKLYTWLGNQVVIGRGYTSTVGAGGGAPPGGSAWMWATSPIFGFRGQPYAAPAVESFDRSVNTVKFIAEQTYLLAWHCCRVGVLVTTGGETAGEPTTPLQDT